MKPFIHEDFLLDTDMARDLYHRYVQHLPIIDYHCHLPGYSTNDSAELAVRPETSEGVR